MALKFYSSVRLDVRRTGKVTQGDVVVGNRTRVKVVKNKCAPPFTEAEFDIRWGTGIDGASDILETALELGILEKSGSYLQFEGKTLAQGKERAREALSNDAQLAERLARSIRAQLQKSLFMATGALSDDESLPAARVA